MGFHLVRVFAVLVAPREVDGTDQCLSNGPIFEKNRREKIKHKEKMLRTLVSILMILFLWVWIFLATLTSSFGFGMFLS